MGCKVVTRTAARTTITFRGQQRAIGELMMIKTDGTGYETLGYVQFCSRLEKEAETADDRSVNRRQHMEYLPGDEYRSPDSMPLVILADWPDGPGSSVH